MRKGSKKLQILAQIFFSARRLVDYFVLDARRLVEFLLDT